MKEVEKLWLEHYNQLCEKLLEVVREKCTGCQTDANQLGHELCLLASAEEQVNLCFEEVLWSSQLGRCHELLVQESTRDANSFKSRDISYFQRNF